MENKSHHDPNSEQSLIEQLSKGDLESYRILFYRYYPTVLAFVRGMTKDLWTSEDIAQNTFMKVWLNRQKLNAEQSLKNYLFVIAKHEVFNHFRSKQSSMLSVDELLIDNRTEPFDTEQQLSANQLSNTVESVINKMPAQRQKIFRMSRQQYLSNSEIATRMGLSVKTVDKHIELALRQLKKVIGPAAIILSALLK